MKDLINDQFGRVLLAVAIVWTVLAIVQNTAQALPDQLVNVPEKPVQVELDVEKLKRESAEDYFRKDYTPGEKFVIVKPKAEKVFTAVDLEVPPLGILVPPQIVADPGPALEGTVTLPRFGREFPDAVVVPEKKPASAN